MDRRGYRMGGTLLALGGSAGIVGGALHGSQPGTLDAFAQVGTTWTVSHVAIGLAGALLIVGALFLAREFSESQGEAWALAGTGTLLAGGFALLMLGALETAGFTGLLAAREAGSGVAADHAFLGVTQVMTSVAALIGLLTAAAIASYGMAMIGNPSWPGWLAWLGVAVGLFSLVTSLFDIPLGPAAVVPLYAGNGWFALAGVVFFGKGGAEIDERVAPQPTA